MKEPQVKCAKFYILTLVVVVLTSCASYQSPLPTGYIGSTATIDDSLERVGGGGAYFYYIKTVDGRIVRNALLNTAQASYGKGIRIIPMGDAKEIATGNVSLELVARPYFAADVSAMFSGANRTQVTGIIEFSAEPEGKYIVSGEIKSTHAAVWIEDIDGNIVSPILKNFAEGYNDSNIEIPGRKKEYVSRYERFINLSEGTSLNVASSKLGQPDATKFKDIIPFSSRPAIHLYDYNDLGRLIFTDRHGKAGYIYQIQPKFVAPTDTQRVKAEMSTSDEMFRIFIIDYHRYNNLTEPVLDIIAQKLSDDYLKQDAQFDGLAWICIVIEKSKNARYKNLLTNVSTHALSKKVKKHASKALMSLNEGESSQFEPN